MYLPRAGKAAFELGSLTGWINWAGRHPGIMLLGALTMTLLAMQQSPESEALEQDSSGEDVPLFI